MHQLQEGRGAAVGPATSARLKLVGAAALVAVADQVTKAWALSALSGGRRIPIIGEYFELALVRNSGAAFGLFPGATQVLFVASLIVLVVVLTIAWRKPENPVLIGMVIGGGLGNILDRLFRDPGPTRGHVIDFLSPSFWPTFNLADSAISIGVVLILVTAIRTDGKTGE